MRIVHLSHADIAGGAARAAYRLHWALRSSSIDSRMEVNDATSGEWSVRGAQGKAAKISARLRPHLGAAICRLQKSPNQVLHSPALLPGRLAQRLAGQGADLVNLHWINGEMCSIAELGRLRLPVVWTMHDMWPFSGAEHYASDQRWKEGYLPYNRAPGYGGFDLDRWTWRRKCKHWTRPFHLVAPSRWLANCASQSALTRDWPVSVIPNALDLELWQPVDRALARRLLNLPLEPRLVLFGAMGGTRDPRKGSELLTSALDLLARRQEKIELVVFGQSAPQTSVALGFPVHYMGHLHDEVALRLLYSACDLFVLPSRQDNLPNTGVEAQACGLPVVGFDVGGMSDIVSHHESGYLAQPFEIEDLAQGISWCLKDSERHGALSAAARRHAEATYAAPIVAAQYAALYREVLGETTS